MHEPTKPGIYAHFKGNEYLVFGDVSHSETGEVFVLYRPLYGDARLTVRPKNMFHEEVARPPRMGPRFKLVVDLERGVI
jgi:hypothetical protein